MPLKYLPPISNKTSGNAYCEECTKKGETVKELGVCSDCEEVYEAEED